MIPSPNGHVNHSGPHKPSAASLPTLSLPETRDATEPEWSMPAVARRVPPGIAIRPTLQA